MFYSLVKSPLSSQDLIDALNNFQHDLILIIGSVRFSHHPLSAQEILSEVNNYIVHNAQRLSQKRFYHKVVKENYSSSCTSSNSTSVKSSPPSETKK